MSVVYHIPKGNLELPEPPEGHVWSVRNVITTNEEETLYSILVQLLNPENVPVATVSETWDRKIEQYSDFAVSVVGLAQVELGAYLAFSAIDWGRDNPTLQSETTNHTNTKIIKWSSKTQENSKKKLSEI